MVHEPGSELPGGGSPGVRVEPASEVFDRESVPPPWLVGNEADQHADLLDRLTADHEWVTELAWAGYQGAQWEFFVDQLARYGMGVIGAGCAPD